MVHRSVQFSSVFADRILARAISMSKFPLMASIAVVRPPLLDRVQWLLLKGTEDISYLTLTATAITVPGGSNSDNDYENNNPIAAGNLLSIVLPRDTAS